MGKMCLQSLSFMVLVSILATLIEYGEMHPSYRMDTLKRDTASSAPNSIIKLVSVARSPAANGNRYSLRFTKDVDDVLIYIQDNMVPPRVPDSVTEESEGVWVATFDLPHLTETVLYQAVMFGDPDLYHQVVIMLDNYGSEPASHDLVELPVIHLDPETEAVYDSGEDVFIKGFVPRNNQTGEVIWNLHKSFMGVDLDTMEFYMDLDDDDLFTLRAPQELDDRIKANMTIHTSSRPVSGYLQLATDILDTGGLLVQYIMVSRSLIVRPSDQAGPYPTGYLVFNNFPGEKAPNGNEKKSCSVGSECLLYCFASGQAISEIQVKEVSLDGSLVDVPTAQDFPMATGTSSGMYWTFQAELDSGDSQGITTFQCKASDDVHGTQVTKLIDVQATIEGSIISEGSSFTADTDPTDPSKTRLTFRCAVRGRPLPTVYFDAFAYHVDSSVPDRMDRTGPYEAVAVKVLSIDTDFLIQSSVHVSEHMSSYCALYDYNRGEYVTHYYENPDLSS